MTPAQPQPADPHAADPTLSDWLEALALSQRNLTALTATWTDEDLARPSYATEWSVAQVLSHLGSGAEIFVNLFRAGQNGDPIPGQDVYTAIWAKWDGMSPRQQVSNALRVNDEFLATIGALSDESSAAWNLELYGAPGDLSDLVYLRLGEHALHTWDVDVGTDDGATVSAAAVELLTGRLTYMAPKVARPAAEPVDVAVDTQQPSYRFRVVSTLEDPAVGVTAGRRTSEPGDAEVRMPAETWLRLVYGRLRDRDLAGIDGPVDVVRRLQSLFPGV